MFYLDLINNTCKCQTGWLAGNYCTIVFGCITVISTSVGLQCKQCNISAHLNLDTKDYQCKCTTGFQINNGVCIDICGDGLIYTNQCDDGNLIDGDGCS